ncbi:MAG: DUF2127 domain-containing protein [Frankiales bacterium]|nr:DUF2127 domain-containing protein [Frankiales bacterium]
MDWNLRYCSRHGHATYAPDEQELRDRLHVTTPAGEAWRCLRCATFVVGEPAGRGPAQDAPEVPRGRLLRDRVIMRLLATERGFKAVLLLALGIGILRFRGQRDAVAAAYQVDLPLLRPFADQIGWNIDGSFLTRWIEEALGLSESALTWIAVAVLAYAALQAAEAVGLWTVQRWGEYLAVVATSVFLPLEVHELLNRVTVLRLLAFAVNVAAVVWLLWSKRLFGLRGGGAAYHAEHAEESLLTVERAAAAG